LTKPFFADSSNSTLSKRKIAKEAISINSTATSWDSYKLQAILQARICCFFGKEGISNKTTFMTYRPNCRSWAHAFLVRSRCWGRRANIICSGRSSMIVSVDQYALKEMMLGKQGRLRNMWIGWTRANLLRLSANWKGKKWRRQSKLCIY
jgi:hypothetical protein